MMLMLMRIIIITTTITTIINLIFTKDRLLTGHTLGSKSLCKVS